MTDKAKQRWTPYLNSGDGLEQAERERDGLRVRHSEAVGLLEAAGRGQDRAEQQAASMREALAEINEATLPYVHNAVPHEQMNGEWHRHFMRLTAARARVQSYLPLSQPPTDVEEASEANETPQWLDRAAYSPTPQQHVEQPEGEDGQMFSVSPLTHQEIKRLANLCESEASGFNPGKGPVRDPLADTLRAALTQPSVSAPVLSDEERDQLRKAAQLLRETTEGPDPHADDLIGCLHDLATQGHRREGESQPTLREALERAWLLGWHYRDDMGERTSVDGYTKVAEAHAYAALRELAPAAVLAPALRERIRSIASVIDAAVERGQITSPIWTEDAAFLRTLASREPQDKGLIEKAVEWCEHKAEVERDDRGELWRVSDAYTQAADFCRSLLQQGGGEG